MIFELIVSINGQNRYLDTADDAVGISLNFNIADVADIASKNSSYSKTINLPDTKNNRDAFEYIFTLNSNSNFDPTKKSKCWILKDTVIQFEGNIQLTQILYSGMKRSGYACVVYSDNDTLFKNIGERYLTDLDMSQYDHQYSYLNATSSWIGDYSKGYYYPLIDYGFPLTKSMISTYSSTTYSLTQSFSLYNMYPSTYVKSIVDQIFLEAGYGYNSQFFNSTDYKKLIVPFNNKSLIPTIFDVITDSNDTIFIVKDVVSVSTISNQYIGVNETTEWCSFSRGTETYDPNGFYEGVATTYYFRNTTANSFIMKFKFDLDIFITANYPNPSIPFASSTTNPYDDILIMVKRQYLPGTTASVGSWFNAPAYSYIFPYASGGYPELTFNGLPSYSVKTGLDNSELSLTYSTVGANVVYRIQGTIYSDDTPLLGSAKQNEQFRFFLVRNMTNVNYTNMTVIGSQSTISGILNRQVLAIGGDINMARNLPLQVKQKDFLTSIMKMFNLYMEPEKGNPNSFIIEPRDDYYRNYQVIKDWSNKLDVSKDITSMITSNTQNRSNTFTYKTDKDYYNTDYFNTKNEIFGTYKYDIDNDFIKGEKKIELIFSPTPMNKVSKTNGIYVPEIITMNNGVISQTPGFNIRILYANRKALGTGTQSDTFVFGGVTQSHYPYAGYVNDPVNSTYSINFGQVPSYYAPYNETINTLFHTYYLNQMIELSDRDSRIVTAYFNLTSVDISQFKFSDLIFFKFDNTDGYYHVNKIFDYDPSSNSTTKVELLKVKNYNIPRVNSYLNSTGTVGSSGGGGSTLSALGQIPSGGSNNTNSGSAFILGSNNNNSGNYNFIGGNNNVVSGNSNIVLGNNNMG